MNNKTTFEDGPCHILGPTAPRWLGTRHGLSLTRRLELDLWLSLGYPCMLQASTTSQLLRTAQAASHVSYQPDRVSLEWLITCVQKVSLAPTFSLVDRLHAAIQHTASFRNLSLAISAYRLMSCLQVQRKLETYRTTSSLEDIGHARSGQPFAHLLSACYGPFSILESLDPNSNKGVEEATTRTRVSKQVIGRPGRRYKPRLVIRFLTIVAEPAGAARRSHLLASPLDRHRAGQDLGD